ncbi:DNA-directed RNA polymerase II subunit rpb1, partial [Blyttiomyces sp. JEL0837]
MIFGSGSGAGEVGVGSGGGGALVNTLTRRVTRRRSTEVEIGTPVKEGHANYMLMYDMLTGIRVSVSRCNAKPIRELEEADFNAAHKLAFDVTGNELTPSSRYDFKFKDYSPWVFRKIRDVFHVEASEYLLSLTGKYVLSELGSPGKSGSFFYFSQDYRFIIKTIHKSEHKFIRKILIHYYEHVKSNPETLLSRIYGLHRVKLPGNKKIHFVVMGNVFPSNKDIHETYDLKGSTVGRIVKEDEKKKNPRVVLKDLNWVQKGRKLFLGPVKKDYLMTQIERDVLFLKEMHIMDYSLLVGCHNLVTGNKDNIRDATLAVFDPNADNLTKQQIAALSQSPRSPTSPNPLGSPTSSSSEYVSQRKSSRATAIRRMLVESDPVLLGSTSGRLPEDMPPERRFTPFYQEMGGLLSTDDLDEPRAEVYYLGIIDIFTKYDASKKAEHFFKSILSNGKAQSVANIEFPETRENDRIKPGGLLDSRMGTSDRYFKCEACSEDFYNCPGHFGHIELAKSVYHPSFIKKVKKVLECICIQCGQLRVNETNTRFKRAQLIKDHNRRFDAIWDIAKAKMECDMADEEDEDFDAVVQGVRELTVGGDVRKMKGGCGSKQPKYKLDALRIVMVYKPPKDKHGEIAGDETSLILTADQCRRVFQKISDQDCELLGLSSDWARPEWMIISILPVPPMPVRPSIVAPGVPPAEDDLTFALQNIVKANNHIKNAELNAEPPHVVQELVALLQYHVATMMDNNISGLPQSTQRRSGRPLKSLRARLKGKEGRLRGNLMGKRVDFSARTVITGDPNLYIDQVGIPRSIAKNLTFPETVTPFNIDELQYYVSNGPTQHPGAKFVVRDNGDRIDLNYSKSGGDIHLQYGYKVERHLIDDDLIIFNRQPSLHKMSMMGHRVKVMPYSTFRLNLSVTTPYNADFDGDEMNLHVPQTHETRAEVNELCMTPKQVLSPQKNGPCMGIVQDTLLGIRKFTKRDNFLTKEMVMNILMWITDWDGVIPTPAILKPVPLWTGKQMLSMVFPKINVDGYNSQHPDDEKDPDCAVGDSKVIVQGGDLVAGILCKKTVGPSGVIPHVIAADFGPESAKQFFYLTQKVVDYWLLQDGFSIGIGDMIADDRVMDAVNERIRTAKDAVNHIIEQAEDNTLKPETGLTIRATFEAKVTVELNKARDNSGKLAERSLSEHNNAKQMVIAGSKGSAINISQMAACVGQQTVEGKRIPFGFRGRTLPHFAQFDQSPDSRGFVENSYLRGLTPQEFFFHAMGGREGLIDTAIKTAETGYIQRRLVKSLEDVMCQYDSTVRNSAGEIIQFLYGEDGMDGARLESQALESMKFDNREFDQKYRIDVTDPRYKLSSVDDRVTAELMNESLSQSLMDEEFAQVKEDRRILREEIFPSGYNRFPLPFNLRRLITNACQSFNTDGTKLVDLSPLTVIEGVRLMLEKLVVVRGNDYLRVAAQNDATLLFQIHVRSILASRRVLEEYKLNSQAFT